MAARKIVHLSVEQRRARGKEVRDQQKDAKAVKRAEKTGQKSIAKAHTRDSLQALSRRPVRPVHHRLLRALRRPERTRLPGVHRGDPIRTT